MNIGRTGTAAATLLAVLFVALALPALGQTAGQINYQGYLTDDGGTPINGTQTLRFAIYPDSNAATSSIWHENQSGVTVDKGQFNVILGSITPIPDTLFYGGESVERWLGITIAPSDEIWPRTKLTFVPWAFHATAADTVLGVIPVSAHDHDDRYFTEIELSHPGTINAAGNPVDWTKLKNVPADFADGVDDAGGAGDGHSLDAVDGLPMDAVYVDEEGWVGIGTTDPKLMLDVTKTWNSAVGISIENDHLGGSSSEVVIFRDENGPDAQIGVYDDDNSVYPSAMVFKNFRPGGNFRFATDSGEWVRIQNDGNVGIGTETPAARLDVAGTAEVDGLRMPTGAVSGRVLTADASGNATWQPPQAVSDGDWVISGNEMYANVSGDVGIGVTNPSADLHVQGSGSTTTLRLTPDQASPGTSRIDLGATSSGNYGGFVQFDGAEGMLELGYNSSGSYTNRIRMDDLTPYVEIPGMSNSVVFDMGAGGTNTVTLPQGAVTSFETGDEPGVASQSEGLVGISLDGTTETLLSRSIYHPMSGYVLVIGTCQGRISHTSGVDSWVDFGVSDQAGVMPENQDVAYRIPDTAAAGSYDFPITVQAIFEVTGTGTPTFYLLAEEHADDGTAYDMQLSLIYFPTAYGTVSAPVLAGGGGPVADDDATLRPGMSPSDIAAERAEAEAFNTARIDRELAAIRAELAEIRAGR